MPPRFFRRYLEKHMPDPASIRSNRWLSWLGEVLHHPCLWQLNRRSVAGAVAIGMFSGLVPGPLQMLTAALLAVPLKKNLPIAMLVTLYTNPFTIVPLYLLAYGLGRLLTGHAGDADVKPFDWDWSHIVASMYGLLEWMLSLGKPLAIGLVALALILAAAGYALVHFGWKAYVIRSWKIRCRQRRLARTAS
jgi:uncharacterized protein (DUF2062 family)